MEWKPQTEDLSKLIRLMRDSTSSDNYVHSMVQKQLEAYNKTPEYYNYLAYIFSLMTQEDSSIRVMAGLLLKNNISQNFSHITPQSLAYVKNCSIHSLADNEEFVRKTAGTVITTIVSCFNICTWPELLPTMFNLMSLTNPSVVEAAFGAIQKICEDSAESLSNDPNRPLDLLLPKLIESFAAENPRVRACAIASANQFVMMHSESLFKYIDHYLEGLFKNASHPDSSIRQQVCQAFVMLLEVRPDKLMPCMNQLVDYMLYSTQEENEEIALEACEFWLTFADQENLKDTLSPYIHRIIPVLVKGMVYSEMDIIILGGEEDDAHVPDRDQDIKPRQHRAKKHEMDHSTEVNSDDGLCSDYDEDDDDDDEVSQWNLRKCSAAALDVISTIFGSDILEVLLPTLNRNLESQDWKLQECAVLALGAIAEGCLEGMEPHLPQLLPFLIQSLKSSKPLIRSITCWTLGRYSTWVVQTITEDRSRIFEPLLVNLLGTILDNNKRVQEAGCSAFATLEEAAGTELIPYLEPIIQTLVFGFTKYQHKNLLILYDAVGTLADSVGRALNDKRFIAKLMPPLIEKWESITDDDKDLFPLFECLASVAIALGPGFSEFAAPVANRSVHLIKSTLECCQRYHQDPTTAAYPERDFMVVSLDLLSGVVQALGSNSQIILERTQPPVMQILLHCLMEHGEEVRQSAYALLGDIAIACHGLIKPLLPQIFSDLIKQINPRIFENPNNRVTLVSVCNNAIWSIGEIAIKEGPDMQPYIHPLLERLIPLLTSTDCSIPKSLLENAAIVIGRLGIVCTDAVAPHLEIFADNWCKVLCNVRDNEEKESAFTGFCEMVRVNPSGLQKSFLLFCQAVIHWNQPSDELNNKFSQILHGYHNALGDRWATAMSDFPAPLRQRLHERYGI